MTKGSVEKHYKKDKKRVATTKRCPETDIKRAVKSVAA